MYQLVLWNLPSVGHLHASYVPGGCWRSDEGCGEQNTSQLLLNVMVVANFENDPISQFHIFVGMLLGRMFCLPKTMFKEKEDVLSSNCHNKTFYCLKSYKERMFLNITYNSLENLHSSYWSNNFWEEASQPFIIGDGSITVLIHLLEQSQLLFWSLVRSRESKSMHVWILGNKNYSRNVTSSVLQWRSWSWFRTLCLKPVRLCQHQLPGNTSKRTSRSSCKHQIQCHQHSCSPSQMCLCQVCRRQWPWTGSCSGCRQIPTTHQRKQPHHHSHQWRQTGLCHCLARIQIQTSEGRQLQRWSYLQILPHQLFHQNPCQQRWKP